MAQGSTQRHARDLAGGRQVWHAAIHRGVILAAVVCLHIGLFALLLGSTTTRRAAPHEQSATHDALQIRWVRVATRPSRATRRSSRPRPIPVIPLRAAASKAARETTAAAISVRPAGAAPRVADDYHSPLFDGRSAIAPSPASRVPGSDVVRVRGIRLHTESGLQQWVRVMSKSSRCKYTRMKMAASANQFVTRQLMERALEADGCGPQLPHTADDHAVEVISRHMLFGD